MMVEVLLARRINAVMGGMVVAPWQVGELPEAMISAILAVERIPEMAEKLGGIKDKMKGWKAEHHARA